MNTVLYLVIPCYNEEEVLPYTKNALKEKMESLISKGKISSESRIVFVNDGSRDKTWELIEQYHEENELFSGVKLSRNKGHQNALLAGLMTVKDKCDITISLDADLQDDINAIEEMVDKYHEGCEIVYGVRSKRDTDTFFKKTTAEGFYKIMSAMGADIVFNHADYRLMSKRALDELENFKEVNLFLRGIVPMIGFKTDSVYYERREREHGESKYPLKKMISFAGDGITSLSVKPIRLITSLGIIFTSLSILAALICMIVCLITSHSFISAAILCSIWCVCGIQLIAIGIIGTYIGKIYFETKARPKFIVEKFINR